MLKHTIKGIELFLRRIKQFLRALLHISCSKALVNETTLLLAPVRDERLLLFCH